MKEPECLDPSCAFCFWPLIHDHTNDDEEIVRVYPYATKGTTDHVLRNSFYLACTKHDDCARSHRLGNECFRSQQRQRIRSLAELGGVAGTGTSLSFSFARAARRPSQRSIIRSSPATSAGRVGGSTALRFPTPPNEKPKFGLFWLGSRSWTRESL